MLKTKIKRLPQKIGFFVLQIIVVIFGFLIIENNLLEQIDINAFEYYFNFRNSIVKELPGFQANKEKIVIVGIDEKFFSEQNISIQGLHRGYYAQAINNLQNAGADTIGVDVLFEKPYEFKLEDSRSQILNRIFNEYDRLLAETLNENVVLASMKQHNQNKIIKPDDLFLQKKPKIGHINSIINVRGIELGIKTTLQDQEGIKSKPFSLKIANNYIKNQQSLAYDGIEIDASINDQDSFISLNSFQRTINIPKTNHISGEEYILTPIYHQNQQDFKYLSLHDVIENKDKIKKVENSMVLIGATDPSLQDIKTTILGNTPGVLVHGNSILSVLNEDFLYKPNKEEIITIFLTIISINIFILLVFKNTTSQKFIFLLLFAEIIGLVIIGIIFSFLSIANGGTSIMLPIGTIGGIITIQLILTTIYYLIITTKLKEKFQTLFGLYVGKNLKKQTESDDQIGQKHADEKNIAVFFSDIAGFTELSEKLTPKDNINFLNIYLDSMSEDISINKGFIDKYIGDAIMAFWEGQNGCYFAAKAAILNILSLKNVNQQILDYIGDDNFSGLQCRIGLHYGKAIVGDIGSENYKLNYTVIGDNVNLASRLEGINKFYGSKICASEEFINKIKNSEEAFIFRKLDKIKVKGKQNSLVIYEIFPVLKKNLSTIESERYYYLKNMYENGLEEYFCGNFENAINYFEQILAIKQDKASQTILERCKTLMNLGIESWDGVWKFDEK